LLVLLVLRSSLRRRRQGTAIFVLEAGWYRGLALWEERADPPESLKNIPMFWGGLLAGTTSAGITRQLDVMKVLHQVGRNLPTGFSDYFMGIDMGCVAQGACFAVTLLLNAMLQKLVSWEKRSKKRPPLTAFVALCFSMIAAGFGEVLTSPCGVIKNFQIANGCGMRSACVGLWGM